MNFEPLGKPCRVRIKPDAVTAGVNELYIGSIGWVDAICLPKPMEWFPGEFTGYLVAVQLANNLLLRFPGALIDDYLERLDNIPEDAA